MATLDDENKMKVALNENLVALNNITPESLIRSDVLGSSMSFEAGFPYFQRTLRLFNTLKSSNLDGVPFEALNEMNELVKRTIEEFKKIKEFSPEKYPQNPISSRDQLIGTIRDSYNEYYKKLIPHISYSIRKGTDFEVLESQAKETLTELMKFKNEIITEQNEAKKESELILASMRKAAGEAGVSQNAIYFSLEAEEHKVAAGKWLSATKWMAFSTVIFAVLAAIAFFVFSKDLSFEQSIQLAVAKILVFSVFYYATVWCGKNYRAYLHNYVINKHRQNGLSTFEAFVKATDDVAIKNAVLLKSTESIFGLAHSGFISSDSEQSGSSQILEIIRSGFESRSGKS